MRKVEATIGCALRAAALASSVGTDRETVNGRRMLQRTSLWESLVQRRDAGHVIREQEIETVDGAVHRLLSVDGHEPSSSEREQNDERLRDLTQNPRALLEFEKRSEADENLLADLLRVMPERPSSSRTKPLREVLRSSLLVQTPHTSPRRMRRKSCTR